MNANNYRKLSAKEIEVLELLAKGYSVKEAAAIFGTTLSAAEKRLNRAREALGVPSHVNSAAIIPILALNTEGLVPYVNNWNPPSHITERQREILSFVTSGMKPAEIAKELRISAKTVESHMQAIRAIVRKKLGGDRRVTIVELVHYAIAHRITPLQFTGTGVFDLHTHQLEREMPRPKAAHG